MTQLSSAEPAKPQRQGLRKISTFTPAQLTRKRANDREAQRVIRARTKEHIKRLEHELAELKSKRGHDQTIQELLRRNEAIENELIGLKTMRASTVSSSYSVPGLILRQLSLPDEPFTPTVYDGNLSTGSDAIPRTRESSSSRDHSPLRDYSQQYAPLFNNCESLADTFSWPLPSSISIPSSLADYSDGYIPISAPTSVLSCSNISVSSPGAIGDKDSIKTEYNEMGHHSTITQDLRLPDMRHGEEVSHTQYQDVGLYLGNPPLQPCTFYSHTHMLHNQQQSTWDMYPIHYS
ncbi:hypothetical protein DER45DRAFT_540275 [Fusarium avenaceum]|nr:hypothetical protein DER45DRAFT_540275 [Fusarium avenaceum]